MFFYTDKNLQNLPEIKDQPASSSQSERRYLPRWNTQSRIVYRKLHDNSIHECVSRDINCKGLSILTDDALLPNQKLNMTVYLSDMDYFSIDATVLWKKMSQEKSLVGLHFDMMDEEIRDMIFNFAFEYKKQELLKHWYDGF